MIINDNNYAFTSTPPPTTSRIIRKNTATTTTSNCDDVTQYQNQLLSIPFHPIQQQLL
jgi:hypothetical protein